MTLNPSQLVDAILLDAARAALRTDTYAASGADPKRLAAANRGPLLLAIATAGDLRRQLASRYADELVDTPAAVKALLGADAAAARAAATQLATPGYVRRLNREQSRRATTAQPLPQPVQATATPDRRADRRLAETRAARDRALVQRDYAQSELRTVRQELNAALSDRDEAQAIVDALQAELDTERSAAAKLAGDVDSAAALFVRILAGRPQDESAETVAVEDVDPRELEARADQSGPADRHSPDATRLMEALIGAGILPDTLASALQLMLAPPSPPPTPALTQPREIALTPLGGGTEIGGSCMLITAGDARILVDAGMRPKTRIDLAGPEHIDIALAGHLDAIVITHAHNDHAGWVPALIGEHHYRNVPVYCTPDTAALLPIMWNDSVKVFNRTRADYVEDGEPPAEPPYTQTQALAAQRRVRELDYGRVIEVGDGVTIELFRAGHILGAAGVVVAAGPNRVTVTGDVSNLVQRSVPGLVVPDSARNSDLLVIESTYCHADTNREAEVERFVRLVADVVENGRVLVPAFALGRAQEVALTLRERLPGVPVLIDGMAKQISRIYEQQTADTSRPLRIYGDQIREVAPDMRAQHLRTFRRGVIVTTSGMLAAGPAVTWARAILPDPGSALLVAGYQDEDAPGRDLLDLVEGRRTGTFWLDGSDIEVHADVRKFGLSAHADRRGLLSIMREVAPRQVMLVHGERYHQRGFTRHLERLRYDVAPTRHWQT